MAYLKAIAALIVLVSLALAGPLPDPRLTPGERDPAVTQANIHQTICIPGYTAKVRKTTIQMKRKVFERYHIPWSEHAHYEVDHFIPLSIGGADKITNLWPEPYMKLGQGGARDKDVVEHYLQRRLCRGDMTLDQAGQAISHWPEIYKKIKGAHPTPPERQR